MITFLLDNFRAFRFEIFFRSTLVSLLLVCFFLFVTNGYPPSEYFNAFCRQSTVVTFGSTLFFPSFFPFYNLLLLLSLYYPFPPFSPSIAIADNMFDGFLPTEIGSYSTLSTIDLSKFFCRCCLLIHAPFAPFNIMVCVKKISTIFPIQPFVVN